MYSQFQEKQNKKIDCKFKNYYFLTIFIISFTIKLYKHYTMMIQRISTKSKSYFHVQSDVLI